MKPYMFAYFIAFFCALGMAISAACGMQSILKNRSKPKEDGFTLVDRRDIQCAMQDEASLGMMYKAARWAGSFLPRSWTEKKQRNVTLNETPYLLSQNPETGEVYHDEPAPPLKERNEPWGYGERHKKERKPWDDDEMTHPVTLRSENFTDKTPEEIELFDGVLPMALDSIVLFRRQMYGWHELQGELRDNGSTTARETAIATWHAYYDD